MKRRIDNVPKILLGYDGSEEGKKAVDFATDLGVKFGAPVDVVTVLNIPVSPEAYIGVEGRVEVSVLSSEAYSGAEEEWEREVNKAMDSAVQKLRSNGLRTEGKILDQTNVAVALASEAEKGAYDILVIKSRGYERVRNLVRGSVTKGIVSGSKTNVLIVR